MSAKCEKKSKPKPPKPYSGPNGEYRWDREAGKWTCRLNAAGRAFLEGEVASYKGYPLAAVRRANPTLYYEAVAVLGQDGANAECLATWTRSAIKFDPERGVKFATYATAATMQNLVRTLFGTRQVARFGRVDDVRGVHVEGQMVRPDQEGEGESRWEEVRGREGKTGAAKEDKEFYRRLLCRMPPRERRLVCQHVAHRRNLNDLSEEYGVTRERARQIIAGAIKKAREEWTADGQRKVKVQRAEGA